MKFLLSVLNVSAHYILTIFTRFLHKGRISFPNNNIFALYTYYCWQILEICGENSIYVVKFRIKMRDFTAILKNFAPRQEKHRIKHTQPAAAMDIKRIYCKKVFSSIFVTLPKKCEILCTKN